MSIHEKSPSADRMLAILRVVTGCLFVTAGTMKFGYPASPMPMPPVELASQMGIGGLIEVVGGSLIVLGLLTRPVAFVLAGEMAVAYFQFHAPVSPFPTVNNGMGAVLFCFIYLYLTAAGAGAWSLDGVLFGRGSRAGVRSPVATPSLRSESRRTSLAA